MAKPKKRPDSAVTVTLYSELRQYVQAFARGHLNLFILVGSPGIEKSQALRTALGRHACWIEGHATPFGIYRRLREKRNRPVVIDDPPDLSAVDANYTRTPTHVCACVSLWSAALPYEVCPGHM